ncbi:hypothetical protein JX266_014225 [Neoarthrinium moseri]|nr:hypothetical protein JX266_014225 [Neoarthrinium moseri]
MTFCRTAQACSPSSASKTCAAAAAAHRQPGHQHNQVGHIYGDEGRVVAAPARLGTDNTAVSAGLAPRAALAAPATARMTTTLGTYR